MENNKRYSLLEILNLQLFANEHNEDEEDDDDEDDDLEEDDFEEDEEEKEPSGKEEPSKKKQSREDNSKFAQQRREREQKEREEKLKKEAYVKGQLDSTKTNTFTGQVIQDEYDLQIYQLQQKIKENGGDPIEDLPRELAKLEREKADKLKKEVEQKRVQEEKVKNDYIQIKEKYPKLDVKELLQNKTFERFSKARLADESLVEIYEDYLEFKKEVESSFKKSIEEKKKKEEAKRESTTPASTTLQNNTSKSKFSALSQEDKIKILKREGLI